MRTRHALTTIATLALLMTCAHPTRAQDAVPRAPGIWHSGHVKYQLTAAAQDRLLRSLRRITGIEPLAFDADRRLQMGDVTSRGSRTARRILQDVLASGDIFVLQDHANSAAVNFGQIESMDYFNHITHQEARVWWIRLDTADFLRIAAAPPVRATFDEGFTVLHELLHALGRRDARGLDDLGECETILNQVRKELGLPLRVDYFATTVRSVGPGMVAIRLRFRVNPNSRRQQHMQYLYFAVAAIPPSIPRSDTRRRAD